MFDLYYLVPYSPEVIWIVVLGFLFAFLLAFGLGSNDVANSFGTSVGSKVLTVRNACYIATVMEISGAVLLGSKVSDTMRKGILDVTVYEGEEKELMLGNLATLIGASIWLIIATLFKLPISATHSVVGATVGFSLVARGSEGIHWKKLGGIVLSWFISPLLSGAISVVLYLLIKKFILDKPRPLIPGLKALPYIYGGTILINVFSIVFEGPSVLYFDRLTWWQALLVSIGVGIIVGIIVAFYWAPKLKKRCELDQTELTAETERKRVSDLGKTNDAFDLAETSSHKSSIDSSKKISSAIKLENQDSDLKETAIANDAGNGVANDGGNGVANGVETAAISNGVIAHTNLQEIENKTETGSGEMLTAKQSAIADSRADDPPEVARLFTFLQILTATFCSFVHGGNDVANAIGPLTAIWLIYIEGEVAQTASTPVWILLYGGLGITVGLWIWGRKVMKTIGTDLSKIVPSTGFVIELGAATTVLIASNIGIPISTTHSLVGSVVLVGKVSSSKEGVNWSLFRTIFFAWVITLPISGGISALVMWLLEAVAMP